MGSHVGVGWWRGQGQAGWGVMPSSVPHSALLGAHYTPGRTGYDKNLSNNFTSLSSEAVVSKVRIISDLYQEGRISSLM